MISFDKNFFEVLYERSLEEINEYNSSSNDLEDNILFLHEIEYKLSILIKNFNAIHPKLLKNIIMTFFKKIEHLWGELYPTFVTTFNRWVTSHPIESAQKFSQRIIDYYLDENGYTEEEFLEEVKTGGVYWGGVRVSSFQILMCMPAEKIKEIINAEIEGDHDNLRNHSTLNDFKETLSRIGWSVEDFKKFDEEFEDDIDAYFEYIEEYDLIDKLIEVTIKNLDTDEQINDYPDFFKNFIDLNDVRLGLEKYIFPEYVNKFGERITKIKRNINTGIKRLTDADKFYKNNLHLVKKQIHDYFDNEDELFESVKKVYEIISKMTISVSLALNINHVFGNIIQDYSDEYISSEFMDNLDKLDVSQWDSEINQLLRKKA